MPGAIALPLRLLDNLPRELGVRAVERGDMGFIEGQPLPCRSVVSRFGLHLAGLRGGQVHVQYGRLEPRIVSVALIMRVSLVEHPRLFEVDLDRDFILRGPDAVAYGVVDEILTSRRLRTVTGFVPAAAPA